MPLITRRVEPIYICRSNSNEPIIENLDGFRINCAVNLTRQMSSISKHFHDIIRGFVDDIKVSVERTSEIVSRLEKIKQWMEKEKASEGDSVIEGTWAFEMSMNEAVIHKSSMPNSLKEVYDGCRKPPALHLLDRFRTDGTESILCYSNPNYFVDSWLKSYDKPKKKSKSSAHQKSHQTQTGDRLLQSSDNSSVKPCTKELIAIDSTTSPYQQFEPPVKSIPNQVSQSPPPSPPLAAISTSFDSNVTYTQPIIDLRSLKDNSIPLDQNSQPCNAATPPNRSCSFIISSSDPNLNVEILKSQNINDGDINSNDVVSVGHSELPPPPPPPHLPPPLFSNTEEPPIRGESIKDTCSQLVDCIKPLDVESSADDVPIEIPTSSIPNASTIESTPTQTSSKLPPPPPRPSTKSNSRLPPPPSLKPKTASSTTNSAPVVSDARSGLLDAIQKGQALRKVTIEPKPTPKPSASPGAVDITAILARRINMNEDESSEESDDDMNDDEWN